MVFGDQTVRDNIALGAYARSLPHAALEAEIDEQYQFFPHLRNRRDQVAATLSGGEQQMLPRSSRQDTAAIGRVTWRQPGQAAMLCVQVVRQENSVIPSSWAATALWRGRPR